MLFEYIIPILISAEVVHSVNVRCFKEMISYENMVGTNDVIFENKLNKDNCWRLCHRHADCTSYFKNVISKECHLMSGISTTTDLVYNEGWKYYAVDNACPISLGYTYNTTADLCFKLTDPILDTDAEAICNADGARVIQITRLEQLTVIADFLKALNFSNSPSIDGRKSTTSNSWTDAAFRDGTAVDVYFWGSAGEPMDDKECIKLDKTDNFAWTSSLCEKNHVYICEVVM